MNASSNDPAWRPETHALGVAEMDATHEEFLRELGRLRRADDADFPRLFDAFREHLRAHFDNESRLMRSCGFPPIAIHEAEHRRVLDEVAALAGGAARGDLAAARAFLAAPVLDWFHNHLATMDWALAACIKARGGGRQV
ncbi:MAG TPA: hemerythrin domain-containing protein [Rhodocyclaceae bacterium]